jgi:hypothetical protein
MCVISAKYQGLRTEIYVLHQSTLGRHGPYELLSEVGKNVPFEKPITSQ